MNANRALPLEDLDRVLVDVGQFFGRLKKTRIFITGGTGIIGKWLLECLLHADDRLDLGLEIHVLTRSPDKFRSESIVANRMHIVAGDVRTFQMPAKKDFDYVIHGATDVVNAANHAEVLQTCTLGTANVLSQAKEHSVRRMLLLSSGAVYGKTPPGLEQIPESYVGPIDFRTHQAAYGEGKRCSELMCALVSEAGEMEIPVARCFAMIGPHVPLDKHFAIGNFIGSALRGESIIVEGDGTPERSYLFMADVVTRLLVLLLDGKSQAYNIGGATAISIKDLAVRVGAIINPNCQIKIKGKTMHGAHANRYIPSVERFDSAWQLSVPVSIDDAIRKTAAWYS